MDNKYENDTHHTTPIVRQRNPLLSPQKSIIVPILPVYPHHVLGASCEPKRQCVRDLLCFRFMHRQIFQFNNDRKGQPPVQVENAGAGAIRFVKLQPGVHSHPKTSIRAEQIVTPIAVKQCGRKCFQVIGGGLRQSCFLQITRKRFSRSGFLKSERFQRLNDLASNQSSFDFELQTRRLDITTQITINGEDRMCPDKYCSPTGPDKYGRIPQSASAGSRGLLPARNREPGISSRTVQPANRLT